MVNIDVSFAHVVKRYEEGKMIQIFFLGSSSIYGVGGETGGYADLVKQRFHQKMYGDNGVGEMYEVYNFGKSGATTDFVYQMSPWLFQQYGRGEKLITVVNVGGNNAKAVEKPDNYVSTLAEYSEKMSRLLDRLLSHSSHVIAVGSGFYDESKTHPRMSPLTGRKSYFSNARRHDFQKECMKLCADRGIPFVGVGVSESEWVKKYLYDDGLHANKKGHQMIAEKVIAEIEKMVL